VHLFVRNFSLRVLSRVHYEEFVKAQKRKQDRPRHRVDGTSEHSDPGGASMEECSTRSAADSDSYEVEELDGADASRERYNILKPGKAGSAEDTLPTGDDDQYGEGTGEQDIVVKKSKVLHWQGIRGEGENILQSWKHATHD
jgi:hypothetical protein